MARYRAIYDDKGKVYEEVDDVVILDTRHQQSEAGYFIMDDIKPYKSMVDGSMIMSRSKHKSHLKQHGMVEIGNEPMREKPQPKYDSDAVKREIARQLYR